MLVSVIRDDDACPRRTGWQAACEPVYHPDSQAICYTYPTLLHAGIKDRRGLMAKADSALSATAVRPLRHLYTAL